LHSPARNLLQIDYSDGRTSIVEARGVFHVYPLEDFFPDRNERSGNRVIAFVFDSREYWNTDKSENCNVGVFQLARVYETVPTQKQQLDNSTPPSGNLIHGPGRMHFAKLYWKECERVKHEASIIEELNLTIQQLTDQLQGKFANSASLATIQTK